jgi:cation diffusion facilitator CzcD-associated flavoprotein CzcO
MVTEQDIIIIGAGMSGIGMAVQLYRKYGAIKFEIIEKSENVGGRPIYITECEIIFDLRLMDPILRPLYPIFISSLLFPKLR